MLKEQVLKELAEILQENTIVFLSVSVDKKPDGEFLPTIYHPQFKDMPYEARLQLSDGLIRLAQLMRERE